MTPLAIILAAFILCYPLSLVAGAVDRLADALRDEPRRRPARLRD